jgi:hypothetical protein
MGRFRVSKSSKRGSDTHAISRQILTGELMVKNAPKKNVAIVVRRMRPEDVSEIHAIHSECLTRSLSLRYTAEQLAAWLSGRTPEGYLRARDSGEHLFVAEQKGVVIGFASWQNDELLALFVHPTSR